MPFNELHRRDSWPPTIVRIRDEEAAVEDTSAIDENPFAFFLTSPEEIDEEDLVDLSAGIETSSKSPQVREVSPSAIQRSRPLLEDEDDDEYEEVEYGLAMPLSLKEFSVKHNDGRKSRQEQRVENKLAGLGIAMPNFSAKRGRAAVKLTPSRSGRGRGQTRSLSARRPHAWRLPSPDIGTIKEERESDDGEDDLSVPKQEKCVSAPPSPEVTKKEVVKPKKRVHWAF
ncbi:hypothetical protein D0Z07_6622 [Hyphodiscus hymeniophilus]|uniref:Uncharacterized protein n=1 Tax=Hyphodiscus hymeniophilus TaxID=353542 RepID=A0A9P6VH01_9HELO|nr:hypothetical protein D0Z07_6622 [Hyphodiscus hymeniophilus]